MIEEDAWPSAQAFTSWAKSVTVSPSILRSTVTVEPHSLEWAVALASGVGQPAEARDIAGQLQNAAVVDVVEHGDHAGPVRLEFDCTPTDEYIGIVGPGAEGADAPCSADGFASERSHAKWECGVRSSRMGRIPERMTDAAAR